MTGRAQLYNPPLILRPLCHLPMLELGDTAARGIEPQQPGNSGTGL